MFVDGRGQLFSAREMAVLEMLMRNSGRVVAESLLENHLDRTSGDIGSNAVEVCVHRVHKRLAESGADVDIHTVRGVGYVMVEEKLWLSLG